MKALKAFGSREGRLFPEGRATSPMPWVIAIMMFLTVLAAATGLALSAGAERIEGEIGNRVTVQIVEANPDGRARQAQAAVAALQGLPGVASARRVPDQEVAALMEPWLGDLAADADLPVPMMIDVDLAEDGRERLGEIQATVMRVAPSAVITDAAEWLGPLSNLLGSLQWLALGLVILMIGATAATVVLAARASLNTHSGTIEILHWMGATDHQITRLFQRRIAVDVLFGGFLGFSIALVVLVLIGGRVAAIGSELLGAAALPGYSWFLLLILPVAGAVLALLVARITIFRALGRLLSGPAMALIPELGLIEGFFGRPWSMSARAETIAFLAPHGYRFYLYAPKADAWLRRQWQTPHPDAELEALAVLAAKCRSLGVRFGIGLSPFELHLASDRDWQEPLARKLAHLDALRPDDLAILFDDMRGDIPQLAERQAAIVSFAAERTRATRILCCPSYYSDDPILDTAFGQRPDGYLPRLGKLLDPAIELFWTGPEVCAREMTPGHLARVAEEMRRKPFLWDNYPVNDGSRMSQHLHLRGFTGRPAEIGRHISAHGINPASQPVLSRIPALTLAESYREGDRYDYLAAFARAAREVVGPELAAKLQANILSFQDRGLDRLTAPRRAELRERYATIPHPAAQEVAAWLDGHWNVTDELVQTQ